MFWNWNLEVYVKVRFLKQMSAFYLSLQLKLKTDKAFCRAQVCLFQFYSLKYERNMITLNILPVCVCVCVCMCVCVCLCSVMSDSLRPYRLWPGRFLCPWNCPGKNTGVGCHFVLQGSSWKRDQTHDSPSLLHCRRITYHCTSWEVS